MVLVIEARYPEIVAVIRRGHLEMALVIEGGHAEMVLVIEEGHRVRLGVEIIHCSLLVSSALAKIIAVSYMQCFALCIFLFRLI